MSMVGRYIEQDADGNVMVVVDTFDQKYTFPARDILIPLISDYTDFVDKVAREVIDAKLG